MNYDELETELQTLGALTNAAETHGIICGFISAGNQENEALWLEAILGEEHPQATEAHIQKLAWIYQLTQSQLENFQFDFRPLLPEDETPLSDRIHAMTGWCQGVLTGLILGRAKFNEHEEAREIVFEFTQLIRADETAENSEEGEEAFFAIIEHIRLSTIFLHSIFGQKNKINPLH